MHDILIKFWLHVRVVDLNYSNGRISQNYQKSVPDSKVHVANMGPTWVLSTPGWPHIGPMNFAIRGVSEGDETSLDRAHMIQK